MQQAVRVIDNTAFFLLRSGSSGSNETENYLPFRRIKEQKIILQGGLASDMRNRFDQQLELRINSLFTWGELCEEAIEKSNDCIKKKGSMEQAEKVRIAEMKRWIRRRLILKDSFALRLSSEQPVARDLRQISAALKMHYPIWSAYRRSGIEI